jgi:hypothetical protein
MKFLNFNSNLLAITPATCRHVDIPEYTDPRTGDSDPPQKVLVL